MQCSQMASQIDQAGLLDSAATKSAIHHIIKECKAALAAISGTLEVDQEALNKVKEQIARKDVVDAPSLQRRGDILQVRINERKILNKTLFTLRRQLTAA